MTSRVLIVATSRRELGEGTNATGIGLETVAGPYYVFQQADLVVDIASVAGGPPPVDPLGLGEDVATESLRRFEIDTAAQQTFAEAIPLGQVDPRDYEALFFSGGHGGMWDFPDNLTVRGLVASALSADQPLAAVCHGVAALCSQDPHTGRALCHGRRLTGLSNEEERLLGRAEVVPFLLQDRLVSAGAEYLQSAPFTTHVVTDGTLITGQNMRSAVAAARQLVSVL